jgi:phosphopantothenoylcysteine synthetase/decarboxylase
MTGGDPVALVVCGAPLSARAADLARHLIESGRPVRVVATRDAMAWVPAADVERVTGYPPLVDQRQPGHAKRIPPPARVFVCPATFNTVNKLAAGIADRYADHGRPDGQHEAVEPPRLAAQPGHAGRGWR